ncbi:cadherin-87A [Planococcus citri]|uniref:cadherin-87A n=1 Tax=Planococcus citri TaxID=170843 RepID=UPI0031F88B46
MSRNTCVSIIFFALLSVIQCNHSPVFDSNLDNTVILEDTPVGAIIGTLSGTDPEGSELRYGIENTDFFSVDPITGEVKLKKSLNREANASMQVVVTIEDKVEGATNNIVRERINFIIEDVNDNAPIFIKTPYKIPVPEDTPVGSTIFENIIVEDADIVGDSLEVTCKETTHPNACKIFEIVNLNSSESYFQGAIVLKGKLNYNDKEIFEFLLEAADGKYRSNTTCEIRVLDVQNSPPIFQSSLTAIVEEDAPIGTRVLTVKAKDGDRGAPRAIDYDLISNPFDFFQIDRNSGEIRTAKFLDREAVSDTNGVVSLTVKAREIVDVTPSNDDNASTTAIVSITIRDVNDEAPTFNKKEYHVNITENTPPGSPLPNLDMRVTDVDIGNNSAFSLRLNDISEAFTIEPTSALGSTSVIVRLASNGSLDYENPNQRKFIILVIAEENGTSVKHSSTSTITVEVLDVNDNAPKFENSAYKATVNESALPGTIVTTITASDRDSDIYGKNSIVYELVGDGADRFNVDKKTGVITVALCAHPGTPPCLDYETNTKYSLTYKATDNEGHGFDAFVPLQIVILDNNDNKPVFKSKNYTAVIDEGATKFEPAFFVKAEDADKTAGITYSILDEHVKGLFGIDHITGEIIVLSDTGIIRDPESDTITFTVTASDGVFSSQTIVNVQILDVNNNQPEFSPKVYNETVLEDSKIGEEILQVQATDADSGLNAKLSYHIEKGSFNDFAVDSETGILKVASKLDYDRRNFYNITITATDSGTPMLTGTAMVQITILNTNDKNPYLNPPLQRAEVPKDAKVGTIFYKIIAADPDTNDTSALNFEFAEPISAVDKSGKEIFNDDSYKGFFEINKETGEVIVVEELQRDIAVHITLRVVVTDTSANYEQQGNGTLMVTILDVNDIPPTFEKPWTKENPYYVTQIQEGLPANTILGTFTARDNDSDIDHFAIEPESEYFDVNRTTGTVYTTKEIDYEKVQSINFTLRAYDIGEPQLSTAAHVIVTVININDMGPVFDKSEYFAAIKENSQKDTFVVKVSATDGDADDFGRIKYSFKGDYVSDFVINEHTGEIRVSNSAALDRETVPEITLKVEATDLAPKEESKSVVVPVHVKIEDVNDNAPILTEHQYSANIVETIPYAPASPIVRLHAEDKDETSRLRYHIVNGNDEEAFYMESNTGILYPKRSLLGLIKSFKLTVEVTDGKFSDKAQVDVNVLDVNQNKPFFKEPSSANASVLIPENVEVNHLVMKVFAEDKDPGENGRVTYHFKVGNNNTQATDEFSIDENTGELRTLVNLDREKRAYYELILVAKDRGTQTTYETSQYLNIILKDIDDNKPMFLSSEDGTSEYTFTVNENNPPDYLMGKVQAEDADEGDNAKIFYYIIKGNEEGMFKLDRRDGSIYVLGVLDRERNTSHEFYIKATNNPNYNAAANEIIAKGDPTIAHAVIIVKDENDNAPYFERKVYYAGIDAKAPMGESITTLKANDTDEGINGELTYEIWASYLYKSGSNKSSGSVIPSPFAINSQGKITTADFVTEYNQDRFELRVIARETAPPNREATATLNIWVYESQQLARVILSRPPKEVESRVHKIAAQLSNATGNVVVVDALRYHVNSIGQTQHDWCDMYLHMINNETQTIVTIPEVLKIIDAKYDYLKDDYAGFAIENVLPAYVEKPNEPFEPALAALVALAIVLFVGCTSVLVLCCCFRHWIVMEPLDMKCDMLIKKPIIDDLSTTENPLWIEQKLKLYEEQELTMQVFCEPEANRLPPTSTFDRRGSDETSVVDNTYATIQHPARRNSVNTMLSMGPGDYATLGGSVLPLDKTSSHSQQIIEAALGFQGCTFQVPEGPTDTTELLRARSELRMNKEGQPEFVSELM